MRTVYVSAVLILRILMHLARAGWYWIWYFLFTAIWQVGVKEIRRAYRTSYDRVEQRDLARRAKLLLERDRE